MDNGAAVVAESHVVERALGQGLLVAGLLLELNTQAAEDVLCVIWVVALGHHVAKELRHMAELHAAHDV